MVAVPQFKKGEYLTVQKVVERSDTGVNIGSGKLDQLLASPMLLTMMIEASARLIDARLEDDLVSVGSTYTIHHELPTLVGETVTLKVVIDEQVGSTIMLSMEAYDETGLIGTGSCERHIASQEVMVKKAEQRIEEYRAGIGL